LSQKSSLENSVSGMEAGARTGKRYRSGATPTSDSLGRHSSVWSAGCSVVRFGTPVARPISLPPPSYFAKPLDTRPTGTHDRPSPIEVGKPTRVGPDSAWPV
jgi:hypothetical protein